MIAPTAPPPCTYQYPTWPSHAPCPEPPWDSEGRCFFHSQRADKPADEMARRIKEKLARGGNNDFAGYVFPAGTDLSSVNFGERPDFRDATFGDEANFDGASFGDRASFFRTTFGNEASFDAAVFGDGADFWGATFGDWADFYGATFGDGAGFNLARFGDEANFGARFGKDTLFEGYPPEDMPVFSGNVDFGDARLGGVVFRRVALPHGGFYDAVGLDTAEFDRVEWGQRGGRPAVADEDTARQSGEAGDCEAAERVYREIRRSYLNRRDFTMARQMHYGEMEMRRLGQAARLREAKTPFSWLSALAETALITAYRLVSGYSTRWQRALVSLTALWLVCTLGYSAELLVQSTDLGASLSWGAQQALFSLILRPLYPPPTLGGSLLSFLEMVSAPIIITALIFAIREQFRR